MLSQLAVIYSEMGQYQESNDLLDYIMANLEAEMPECHYFKANNFAHLGSSRKLIKKRPLILMRTRMVNSPKKTIVCLICSI